MILINEINRVAGQLNLLLNPFSVLAASDVVVSVRTLFSERKILFAPKKPNGFDLNDYQEEVTTPTTKPKPHDQFGLLRWLRAFDSVSCETPILSLL